MYRVSEIAEKLGKSRAAVYKNIKTLKPSLSKYETKRKGVIYYNDKGFDLIANSFSSTLLDEKVDSLVDNNSVDNNSNLDIEKAFRHVVNAKDETIKMLENQLKVRDNQLKIKDEQLREKDKQVSQLIKQNDQAQHLLLNEQKEKQLLLGVKDQYEKQTFIDRLFGKKVKLDDL